MAPRGKITRSTAAQINMLVDYMSTNPAFANNEFTGPLGNQRLEAEWAQLKELLANHGPDKSVEQWKHTWRDLKKKARDDGGRVRLAQNFTGNAVPVPELSEKCSKILNTIGKECAMGISVERETGVGVGPLPSTSAAGNEGPDPQEELLFQIPLLEGFPEESETENPPVVSRSGGRRRTRARPPRSGARRTVLANHPQAFINAQKETNKVLRDISNTMVRQEKLAERHQLMELRRARRARGGNNLFTYF